MVRMSWPISARGGRPTRRTAGAAVVLACDQMSVPVQQSPWADDRSKTPQSIAPELLRFGCQAAALVVVESRLSLQLLLQNLYLFLEIFDGKLLIVVEPASKPDQQELQSIHALMISKDLHSHQSCRCAVNWISREFSDSTGSRTYRGRKLRASEALSPKQTAR